jgi:hypothetical protein
MTMRLIRLLIVFLLVACALPSPIAVEAKNTIRRSEATVTIQVPITFVGPSESAFTPGAHLPSTDLGPVTDTFPRDAMAFWNEGLKAFRYNGCYTFQIDVVASTKVVARPDFARPQGGGHTVYMGYGDSQPDDAVPQGDPFAGSLAITWALSWPHDVTGYLMGLKHTVESVDQAVVDELGAVIEKRGSLPKKCVKATQTIESTTEGHPTAGQSVSSTLVVTAAVEDDGSLTGEATFTVSGNGWGRTEGAPECTHEYTGEGVDLVVSGTVTGKTIEIAVDGEVNHQATYSCTDPFEWTWDFATTYAPLPIAGEPDDSGRFEDEQTFQADPYTTTVVTTMIEIVVEEESVA